MGVATAEALRERNNTLDPGRADRQRFLQPVSGTQQVICLVNRGAENEGTVSTLSSWPVGTLTLLTSAAMSFWLAAAQARGIGDKPRAITRGHCGQLCLGEAHR